MARRHGTTGEVVAAFVAGRGEPSASGNENVFFIGDTLYSYGRHFPMAIMYGGVFIVNGDRDSNTTSVHQGLVQASLHGKHSVTVSIGALAAAGIYDRCGGFRGSFIDHTRDYSVRYHGVEECEEADLSDVPPGTTIFRSSDKDGNVVSIHAHRAAMTLWERGGRYYIAGMDDAQYFVSALPEGCTPKTCEEALEELKPFNVRSAEREGFVVKRQGDWFFIDVTELVDVKDVRRLWRECSPGVLSGGGDGSNPHSVDRLVPCVHPIVSGRVRHPQHRMLQLGKRSDPKLWIAVQNTATANWSTGGGVD